MVSKSQRVLYEERQQQDLASERKRPLDKFEIVSEPIEMNKTHTDPPYLTGAIAEVTVTQPADPQYIFTCPFS